MRYKREILVPYLKNVYMAELAKERYLVQISKHEQMISQLQSKIYDEKMKIKNEEKEAGNANWKSFFWLFPVSAVFIAIGCFFLFFNFKVFVYGISGGVLCFILGIVLSVIKHKANVKKQKKNFLQLKESHLQNIDNINKNIDAYKSNIQILKNAMVPVEANRQAVYSANIIPGNYRNAYCAKYLYDYFSTSLEDNLDAVIQTFLLNHIAMQLEEIKSTLYDILSAIDKLSMEITSMNSNLEAIQNTNIATQQEIAKIADGVQGYAARPVYVKMIDCNYNNAHFFATNGLH